MARAKVRQVSIQTNNYMGFAGGIAITLLLALAAKYLSGFPVFAIMGQLVIAILLGMAWRAAIGAREQTMPGVAFSGKKLLRYGIILLGMRLNLADVVHAGPKVAAIAAINIVLAIAVVYGIARIWKVEPKLSMLTACGTAICGAAAVAAISPQIRANDEETAVSAATVAILGTLFTLLYTVLYPVLGLTASGYGVFSGATLHEVAHVIAAAAPGGKQAVDMAVIVKLTRVACLVPAAVLIGLWAQRLERKASGTASKTSWKTIPVPWFIVGFLLMSGVNTMGIFPAVFAGHVIDAAYLLIAMAMAGLGLNVDMAVFRRLGMKPFAAGLIGSILLSGFGYGLVRLFGLA
ncbi:YeiH family protein [Paenibacillus piri]|uniref:YeiH family putative sulfate export transporter n=1 Tax=Paenibacillus piri TaxID=2547395 RepID=A0A4R5KBM6_9BACL|nr:YeiH family protein [Paenibacillus piri]TDF92312.1 YeiH family putative sulfate export transporter [Paenibacillus piri]